MVQINEYAAPPVNEKKLRDIYDRNGDNKFPGLDGMVNRAFNGAMKTRFDLSANIFKACLKEEIFSAKWVGVVPKSNKLPGDPPSNPAICLMNTMASEANWKFTGKELGEFSLLADDSEGLQRSCHMRWHWWWWRICPQYYARCEGR